MDQALQVTPCGATFFDNNGRCIPTVGAEAHPLNRRWFVCEQPEINYGAILERTRVHLAPTASLDSDSFERRAKNIIERLNADSRTQNITKGVKVPFVLPQGTCHDIGTALDDRYVPAVSAAFRAAFPAYTFSAHHIAPMAGTLRAANGSRHERLLDAQTVDDVVGWYFPCLPGFSIPAAIEQVGKLPEAFLLAGGFDTCAALIGSPDLLLRRAGYPPLLWLAGLAEPEDSSGYHFEAYGYNLTFNRRPHLRQAAEYWSSGLVVLG